MGENDLQEALRRFAVEKGFKGKGPLSVALVVTRHARRLGLPLDADKLVTEGGGQVVGLGKNAVQSVLEKHGISRVLAAEGGRTSRGSLGNMREFVTFLNDFHQRGDVDLDAVEDFWVEQVRRFFAAKPFKIKLDRFKGLRAMIRHLMDQAVQRQKEGGGTYYSGALMQHLVGAKLDCALGGGRLEHNSFSTADAPGGRQADFVLDDVAIHVTTSPSEALLERCRENLDDGYRPMVITIERGMAVAAGLAGNAGIADRIDFFEIEQFIALNLYELGGFDSRRRTATIAEIVSRYNQIVEKAETDPSLKIRLKK